ncbi:MAG: alpha-amylase family glycosyl hydrolase [Bacteroidota bacterium]
MSFNPSIYEINTRLWLKRFANSKGPVTLENIPSNYWDDFVKKGFDYVWLMGIWKTCDSVIDKYCFEEGLVKSYDRALKGWKREDIIGSPYAVDKYEPNPIIGTLKSLLELKSQLNKKGIKLILDFVPNHFSADSSLIESNPDIFLEVDIDTFKKDQYTFYQPQKNVNKYFAHGRDPFFPAWQDTAQVNFFSNDARSFLTKTLLALTKVCDGIRCDMAMLALNNVFNNTWGGILLGNGFEFPKTEFWHDAIAAVKKERSDFVFIAEAYWDLEWKLQRLGFDYTYDKSLTDRLKFGNAKDIHEHLTAETEYQKKSVRFIENHDEERAATVFGKDKSKAAAVIISTVQGMHFYHDGQFEGKKIKLPVQLGREPDDPPLNGMKNFYDKLLSITSNEILKRGKWTLLSQESSYNNNKSFVNLLAWMWTFREEKRIVVVNYSDVVSTCRLKLDVRGYSEEFVITDLLNDQSYTRSAEEVYHHGLYIELKPFQAHIFSF